MHYKQLKDYLCLFDLINNGQEVVCFVNYELTIDGKIEQTMRDIAIAKKSKYGSLIISCRGMCYLSVDDFDCTMTDGEKFELFKKWCERFDVSWIDGHY